MKRAPVVFQLTSVVLLLIVSASRADAYVLTGGIPPANAPAAGEPSGDFYSGTYTYSATDLSLAGPMPIDLTRTYRTEYKDGSGNFISGAFGPGFNLNYNMFLYSPTEYVNPSSSWWNTALEIILPNGAVVRCNNNGTYSSYMTASWSCTSNPGPYYGASIEYDSSVSPTNSPGWDVVLRDGTLYQYGLGAPLQAIKDRNGNYLTFTYSTGQSGNLTQINANSGHESFFAFGG